MQKQTTIDPSWSVNDVMARFPATMAVFNEFGIDSCCGAGAPLVEAARRDGADLDALLDALERAVAGTKRSA